MKQLKMQSSPSKGSKELFVIKRDGRKEKVSYDQILERLTELSSDLEGVNVLEVAKKVVQGVQSGIKTSELDNLAAETAAYLVTTHHEYETLAARLAISNLQKETEDSFLKTVQTLYSYINPKNNKHSPLVSEELVEVVKKHEEEIQMRIDYKRDFNYDYFGFKTLCRSYLLKIDDHIVERPQHMLMRVSLGIWKDDLEQAFATYDLMSMLQFTHASPTLFNSGTPKPQCSSCFLLTMTEDSIKGIFETLARCAEISKTAGGIGLSVHCIRASGSYIAGTNGISNGLVPLLRVYNNTARYVDQGGGKRKGAFAIYLEPWHADIFDFLDLKKNHGKDEVRARDLFYALWIPDLFMKRVEQKGKWSLMCPDECPGLYDTYGEEFEQLYEKYEKEGKVRRTVEAQELWFAIIESQIETGTPYMLYKDACNKKSNQKNLGTIRSSNLCTEIIQYTSPDEIAVCNLASLALPKFVVSPKDGSPYFDHQAFKQVVMQVTRNLNKVIDVNYYPVKEAETSNKRHRPIGIGVQGLADAFILLRLPFDSEGAARVNREIFETLYFAALTSSNELAKKDGPYTTFQGSPASQGILQYDMWGVTPSSRWDWASLKQSIMQHGLRNSLLIAPMPTASSSQILGNNECFEPYTSNIYQRRVLSGAFTIVNKHLLNDLMKLGLWNNQMKDRIIAAGGSIQSINEIPIELKELYKTVWEIKQRVVVDMAADRGAYIDQSQSLNIFMANPTFKLMTSMHFYGWKKGLKTGMYYLRTRGAADAIQFTVDPNTVQAAIKSASTPNALPKKGKKNSKPSKEAAEAKPAKTEVGNVGGGLDFAIGAVCTMEDGCISCGS